MYQPAISNTTHMKKLTLFLCAFACVTGYVFSQNPGFEKIPVPDLNTGRIDSRVAYLSDEIGRAHV